jgi:hypothetical protein
MSMMGESIAQAKADQDRPLLPYDGIQISDTQRADFDRDGYFIVRNAIPPELLERLIEAQDRVYAQQKAEGLLSPRTRACT